MITDTENTKSAASESRSIHLHLCLRLLSAIGILFIGAVVIPVAYQLREFDNAQVRRSQDDFTTQLGNLKSGDNTEIYLYDSRDTDVLLRQMNGMAKVEVLQLELTDVSDEGMRSVATLPKLRKLVVYGGNPGIGDRGLVLLKGNRSIEMLELINTRITDDGLGVLKDLHSLLSLTVYCEARREPRLSDAGLAHLKNLQKLETLEITGGWASDSGVADLKSTMPTCSILTQPHR